MTTQVAIVAPDFDPTKTLQLKAALQADGARCTICPETERRDALRWVMDLPSSQYALCIICDNDGRNLSSLSTAIDPQIAAVGWCPASRDLSRAAATLADAPVMICFSESAEVAAQSIRPLLFSNPVAATPNLDRRPLADPAEAREQKAESVTPNTASTYDEDAAVYEQLETLMSMPVKDLPRAAPVQVQKPGIDFSTPLRQLMSKGRSLAQREQNPEVLGLHYLAALDEPFIAELEHAGLTKQLITRHVGGLASSGETANEPIISDEAFDAVSRAKSRVRNAGKECIRTVDFLSALLTQEVGSVAKVLSSEGLASAPLHAALASLGEIDESCANAFFAPSSLDQESFYQFDPAQVRSVQERLRTLPGFQKAAARVAEGRSSGHAHAAAASPTAESPRPASPVAAEPPEKPEILKVSADFPDVDAVEHITDRLLEGQLIALPADVMFALAADASNPYAIDRLREAAGIPEDKPISILINSTSQLKHLVRADLEALEPLFDEFWPGPLTLVFKAAGSIARHVSSGGNIAVRLPADNTSLAVLSMLGRPLAVTSWNEVQPGQPVDVQKLADHLAGLASIVVTHGEPVPQVTTTVIDMTTTPWQILRDAAIPGQDVVQHMP